MGNLEYNDLWLAEVPAVIEGLMQSKNWIPDGDNDHGKIVHRSRASLSIKAHRIKKKQLNYAEVVRQRQAKAIRRTDRNKIGEFIPLMVLPKGFWNYLVIFKDHNL